MLSATVPQALKQQIDANSFNMNYVVPALKHKLTLLYDFHSSDTCVIILNADGVAQALQQFSKKFSDQAQDESLMMYKKGDVAKRNATEKVLADPNHAKRLNTTHGDGYANFECSQVMAMPILHAFTLRGEIVYTESIDVSFSFTATDSVETVNIGDNFYHRDQSHAKIKMNSDTLLSLTWQQNVICIQLLKINRALVEEHALVTQSLQTAASFEGDNTVKAVFNAIFLPYIQQKKLAFFEPTYKRQASLLIDSASRGEDGLQIQALFDLLAKQIFEIYYHHQPQDTFFFMACDLLARCQNFVSDDYAEKFNAMLRHESSHVQTDAPVPLNSYVY